MFSQFCFSMIAHLIRSIQKISSRWCRQTKAHSEISSRQRRQEKAHSEISSRQRRQEKAHSEISSRQRRQEKHVVKSLPDSVGKKKHMGGFLAVSGEREKRTRK
jgi:Flp pilus assembly protein TadB